MSCQLLSVYWHSEGLSIHGIDASCAEVFCEVNNDETEEEVDEDDRKRKVAKLQIGKIMRPATQSRVLFKVQVLLPIFG